MDNSLTPENKPSVLKEPEKFKFTSIKGCPPRVYVPVIYLTGAFLLLFILLILPGILNPGEFIVINTSPPGALVKVNHEVAGSTPFKRFYPPGEIDIEVSLPFHRGMHDTIKVSNPLWAPLFFSQEKKQNYILTLTNPKAMTEDAAFWWSRWGLIRDFSTSPLPPILIEAAFSLNVNEKALLKDLLEYALLFCDSQNELDQILKAYIYLYREGPGSPLDGLKTVENLRLLLGSWEKFGEFFQYCLKGTSPLWLSDSNNLNEEIEFSGKMVFVSLQPGILGAKKPVSSKLFESFLIDRPDWRIENRNELMNKGLVSSTYLLNLNNFNEKMVNVSFFAATEFCEWISPRFPGYKVRLPYSYEYNLMDDSFDGLSDKQWEWCGDWFFPSAFFFSSLVKDGTIKFPNAPYLKAVGGGKRKSLAGAREPAWCDDNTGFRIVLEKM